MKEIILLSWLVLLFVNPVVFVALTAGAVAGIWWGLKEY